jgi:hypothetical protein
MQWIVAVRIDLQCYTFRFAAYLVDLYVVVGAGVHKKGSVN